MLTHDEHAERLELYNHGLNDAQMADRLYLSRTGVRSWRKAAGLPPNIHRKKHDSDKILAMLKDGEPAKYIAAVIGCDISTVYYYRRGKKNES